MQSLTFIIIIASEETAMLKFLPYMDNWLASRPIADHYIHSHFHASPKWGRERGGECLSEFKTIMEGVGSGTYFVPCEHDLETFGQLTYLQ